MFWSLTLQLMPDETIIEDSTRQKTAGVKPTYSVFLTNKRAAFRFDGFGSFMTQSFTFDEIAMAQPVKRMFITYLQLKTRSKEYFLHVPDPDYWSSRLLDAKASASPAAEAAPPSGAISEAAAHRKRTELHGMLATLRKYDILTAEEHGAKSRQVDQLRF